MLYSYMFEKLRKHLRDQKILLDTQINYNEFEKRFFIYHPFEFIFYDTHYEYQS